MDHQAVYIVDAVRTPIGRVNGKLADCSLPFLTETIIRELVQKYSSIEKELNGIVFGNAVSAGAGQNFIRKALIDAGVPVSVPAYTVSNVCASGLQAVINACQDIRLQDADLMIAGGAESVSQMPELIFKTDHELKKAKNLTKSFMHDGLWCSVANRWMGDLCEDLARREGISRKEQDDYAFSSYQKASAAQGRHEFDQEIVPVSVPTGKKCVKDETIRHNVTRAIFDSFESAFGYNGTITAANTAALCDGAAGCLLASQVAVDRYSFKPLAKVVGYVSVAGAAEDVFALTDQAVHSCLQKTQLSMSQIDLFEISEAFSAQMVLVRRRLVFEEEKLNVSGGDVALGHPLGAAGARILTTLVHSLKRKKKHYGLACACLGGGGALAVIIEIV